MDPELLAIIFGLASAASWGSGDFSGGLATRRSNVYGVVIGSQFVGLLLLVGLALIYAEPLPPSGDLLIGAVAGLIGGVGLMALYQGLAVGRMGVVAPIAAILSAALPVLVGTFAEGLPAIPQLAGFALALVAVWLITRGKGALPIQWRELGLPVVAGLGFGLFLVLIDQASETSVFWSLAAARVASLTLLITIAAVLGRRIVPAREQLGLVLLSGVGDAAGNTFYTLAAQLGRMDIAAILSSLYPAATVLLARFVLHEQLTRRQWAGLLIALAAVVLIAL